ncbi:gamma-glutamylcyclotransferase family protein [Methylopila henanensis]|uniref:Gamma-glutamylcyclotransferase family protein n=1 Tax=Methylopila henanensis TaxID=873516 RepID=A0ABW4K1S1_9HYPH
MRRFAVGPWGAGAPPPFDMAARPFKLGLMLHYFAYGANMRRSSMARRCPGAEPVGPARLEGWRFAISRDGYATVLRAAGATTHGVLWRLTERDLWALDAFERVAMGLYRKERLRVRGPDGPRRAIVYVSRFVEPGVAVSGYMTEMVIPAALEWGLPEPYLAELGRFARGARGGPAAQGGFR